MLLLRSYGAWQSFMHLLQADIHFELHKPCQSRETLNQHWLSGDD